MRELLDLERCKGRLRDGRERSKISLGCRSTMGLGRDRKKVALVAFVWE